MTAYEIIHIYSSSPQQPTLCTGWKSIFTVFSLAAASSDEGIAQFAFDMTDHLFRNHFDLLIFDFVDLVNCLLGFAENR